MSVLYTDSIDYPPFFRWLYDTVDVFVRRNALKYESIFTREVHKELERQLYLIVADSIHERLYQGVHRPIEDRIRLGLLIKESDKRIRLAVNQNVTSSKYGTVLHYVACEGYPMVLRLLLERRGNPNVLGVSEETPLQKAILLYNETQLQFMKESYLNVISVLLCYQADKQRLKPGINYSQSSAITEEFRKQMNCNEKGYMSVVSKQVRIAVQNYDARKFREVFNKCNLGLLNLISPKVAEFGDLPFEIGVLYEAMKKIEGVSQMFNNGFTNFVHRRNGSLENNTRHPELSSLDFMKMVKNSYYKWGNYIRENMRLLAFLKECYSTIFSQLHRTPDVNPNNGANLLHYFITIPYFPLCQSALAHSPELIHGQDYLGNTPLHCAFFQAMEEESFFETILQQVISDNYVMHFFSFDKFNLARQTLLHLISDSERGTTTERIVSAFGTRICKYIATQINNNRHIKVDLSIPNSEGWTPFLQLCSRNDPLALPMVRFAHEQELDINLTCPETRCTALHLALRMDQSDKTAICELLLDSSQFKHLRVSSFDLISKSSSLKLHTNGFKYAPLWAIDQYRTELQSIQSRASTYFMGDRISIDRFFKTVTLHPPSDREYVEIQSDILGYLTVSPLLEVLITECTKLFELIVHHTSLDVIDSSRGLKLALELGFERYVKPLICNLLGIARGKFKRRDDDSKWCLHMDLHEGHHNTWCLERILDIVSDKEFRFEDCPKIPKHLLTSLEDKLNFNHIVSIDLAGNSLDRIPDCLLYLNEVTNLYLQCNDIECIPDVPFLPGLTRNPPLPALKDLNISSNRLKSIIPLWIICHRNLEKLNLAMNSLNFVQDKYFDELGITDLETKLREVILQRNQISFIPRYIKQWKTISDLNLSNNSIESLPREIWFLYKLNQLDLADNSIAKIEYPGDICPTTSVKDFDDANQTTILEGERNNQNYCRLKELKLSSNKLQEPPNGLVCVTPNLHHLVLKDNKNIKSIDLRFLPRFLRYLDYSECRIERVTYSKQGGPCFASSQFDIQKGLCDHFKDRNTQFIFLSDLYLNGNVLLQNIKLGESSDYRNLFFPHLRHLHLNDNNLRSLPAHIGYQTKLELLDISNNPNLQKLPIQLAELQNFKLSTFRRENLQLTNNIIPPEASLPTVLRILGYKETECRTSRRYKLAVVGKEGRGKTTLLKNFNCDNIGNIQNNELLGINTWELTNPSDKEDRVEFEVWDLNGNQGCYPVPSCFISPLSVYLLLFRATDRNEGIKELKDWLITLEAMAPGCPVLIVGTHIENMEKNEIELLARQIMLRYHPDMGPFPLIADICFISNKPGLLVSNREQINSLKRAIFEVVSHIHIGMQNNLVSYRPKTRIGHPNALINLQVPTLFSDLENEIISLRTKLKKEKSYLFLNFSELWNLVGLQLFDCKSLFVSGLDYLHKLGILIKFEDIDVYFLSPISLCELFSILTPCLDIPMNSNQRKPLNTSPTLIELISINKTKETHDMHERETSQNDIRKTGIIKESWLFEFLASEYTYLTPDILNTLMKLLEKFEYFIKTKDNELILPAFFPDSLPCIAKLSEKSLLPDCKKNETTCAYHIDRFWFLEHIPYGFWPRLISRLRGDEKLNYFFNTCDRYIRYYLSKSTFEIRYRGCLLFQFVLEESNKINHFANVPGLVRHFYLVRIDLSLFVWSVLNLEREDMQHSIERNELKFTAVVDNIRNLLPSAAILLHRLSNHFKTLLSNWSDMSLKFESRDILTFYIPCQKCFRGETGTDVINISGLDACSMHIYDGRKRVNIFSSEDCMTAVYKKEKKGCSYHGWDNFEFTYPELHFVHMPNRIAQETSHLEIDHRGILAIGSSSLVCRGTFYYPETRSESGLPPHTVCNDERVNRRFCMEYGRRMNTIISSEHDKTEGRGTEMFGMNKHQFSNKGCAIKFLVKHPEQKADSFHHFLTDKEYTTQELIDFHPAILNEMSFCIDLKHRNIVQLLDVGFSTYFYLIFEMAPFGNLDNVLNKYIEKGCSFQYEIILKTLVEICTGLEYIHEVIKLIRGTIRLTNVLVWSFPLPDMNGEITPKYVHLKISGFSRSILHSHMGNKIRPFFGTPVILAPEMFSKAPVAIDFKVDMFAVGVILSQLLTLSTSPSSIELFNCTQNTNPRPIMLNHFVKKCSEINVAKRLSSSEALEWLNTAEMQQTELHAFNMGKFTSIIRTEVPHSEEIDQRKETCLLTDLASEKLVPTKLVVEEFSSRQLEKSKTENKQHKTALDQQQESLKRKDRICTDKSCHLLISSEKPQENNISSNKCLSILSMNLENSNISHQNLLNKLQYRIFAIKLIKSSLWLGTNKGYILVYPHVDQLQNTHFAPFLKIILVNNSRDAMVILDIQHLPSWNCAIVTTNLGDVFFIDINLRANSVTSLHCQLSPVKKSQAINRAFIIKNSDEIQIWCTRGSISNPLTILHLPIQGETVFKETTLESRSITQPLHHITSASFQKGDRVETRVWTSIMNRSLIACWDVDNMSETDIININEACNDTNSTPLITVTSLYTANEMLYVGTSNGCILRYTMDGNVISVLKWFIRSVHQIFQIPPDGNSFRTKLFNPVNQMNGYKLKNTGVFAALGEGVQLLRSSQRKRNEVEYNQDEAVFVYWREIKDKDEKLH